MKTILVSILVILSFCSFASGENTKKIEKKENTKIVKKDKDCETEEELKKKLQQPKVEASQPIKKDEIKTDGFSLKGASTGCSL